MLVLQLRRLSKKQLSVIWERRRNSKKMETSSFFRFLCIYLSCRLYKKGDFEAAIQSYQMSLRYCPEEEEYKSDRVCPFSGLLQ